MNECCSSCRYILKLEKLDYSQGGCKHTMMDGYCCMVFAAEGTACWMVGNDPNVGMCECYEPKEKPHVETKRL